MDERGDRPDDVGEAVDEGEVIGRDWQWRRLPVGCLALVAVFQLFPGCVLYARLGARIGKALGGEAWVNASAIGGLVWSPVMFIVFSIVAWIVGTSRDAWVSQTARDR